MSNDNKETLSQLMDGEWQDLDSAKSVKAACEDKALQATWSRYHLIRDVIRNDAITVDSSLTSRISQAIDDEPSYSNVLAIGTAERPSQHDRRVEDKQTEQTKAKPNYLRTGLSGMALAACVAMATVLGLNFWQGSPDTGANVQSVASVPSTLPTALPTNGTVVPGVVLPEVEYVSNKGTYWVSPEAKRSAGAEKRLNALLSAHIESSATAERTGMLPYSRLVGYDTVAPEQ